MCVRYVSVLGMCFVVGIAVWSARLDSHPGVTVGDGEMALILGGTCAHTTCNAECQGVSCASWLDNPCKGQSEGARCGGSGTVSGQQPYNAVHTESNTEAVLGGSDISCTPSTICTCSHDDSPCSEVENSSSRTGKSSCNNTNCTGS